jgi:hypothetical protein
MSRLVIPVQYRTLYATGDVLLRAGLDLEIKDNAGRWKQMGFLVDSGAEITTVPAWLARRLDLPMPQAATRLARHAQTGLALRSGLLRFRILGMDQTEYATACFFLGDPAVRPGPNAPAGLLPRKLLQPLHLLDRLRFTADKDPAAGMPYGSVVVEKK